MTLTLVDPFSSGRVVVVGMRTILLVATGSKVTSMSAATISGREYRIRGSIRLKGTLEELKTFSFRD